MAIKSGSPERTYYILQRGGLLAKTFDMVIALLIVTMLYLVLAVFTVFANKLYQKGRNAKRLVQTLRNLYLSNLLTLAGIVLTSSLSAKK